jgi:hypothetical protein
MGSHLFTPRSGLNLGIRMRKTYIFLHEQEDKDGTRGWKWSRRMNVAQGDENETGV